MSAPPCRPMSMTPSCEPVAANECRFQYRSIVHRDPGLRAGRTATAPAGAPITRQTGLRTEPGFLLDSAVAAGACCEDMEIDSDGAGDTSSQLSPAVTASATEPAMLLPLRAHRAPLTLGCWDALRHLRNLGPSNGLQCKPACGHHVREQAEHCEKDRDSYEQDENHSPHRAALIRQNRRHLLGGRQHVDIVAAPYKPPPRGRRCALGPLLCIRRRRGYILGR